MKNWKQKEFGQFVNLRKDKYQPTPGQRIPCVELECITKNSGEITHTISSETLSSIKNHFSKGDVLFGKLRPYLRKYALPQHDGVCSTEIWVLHPKEGFCSPEFLFLLIQSNKFIYTANLSCGSRMPRADWDLVSSTPFLLPELQEQQKIVEVLETWDKAIQLTRKLIEQKELQKKYLMQQLLTGRTRLKGFTDSWTEEPFRKLINIYQGYPFKSSSYVKNGTYRIITIANVQQGQLDTTKCNYINELPKNLQTYQRLQIGDLIFSMTGNVGRSCWVSRDNCLLNQRVGKIQTKKINNQFLYHFLQNPKFIYDMIVCAQGGAQANLSVKDILKYHIYFPSDITEQKSIAKILSLNDKEIDLLRQKLAKLEEQKKGLMQVLLTGKVRLQVEK